LTVTRGSQAKKNTTKIMSGISPYADVRPGGDPFLLYKVNGSGFRLAGEGGDVEGSAEDDIEGNGVSLAGAGLGKGTRRKIAKGVVKYAPKVARAGIGLISEFGSPGQRVMMAANALVAGRIVNGAGGCQGKGVALRALMN
jgi:hypothetical protein